MTQHIRRVVVTADEVGWETAPAPVAGPGEVLVRTSLVGVCGSDTHAALGRHPFIELPYRPGHEVVGVIAATGSGVESMRVGDRVVVEPNLYCGSCFQCRSGRYNICRQLKVFGYQVPGGLAELFTIPADRVHILPDAMSDTQAALIEPLATPLAAIAKAGDLRGRTVAILGAGPIGLLLLAAARHQGAAKVAVTDLLASKRARALRLGADAVFPADSPDLVTAAHDALEGAADVVFDCVSRESSLPQAVDLVTKGGLVVVVGVGLPGTTPVRIDLIQDREIRLAGSLMYVAEDFAQAMSLIGSGGVDVDELVTATFPFHEADKAFAASCDPEQVKVLITVAPA
ncbi:alcohol dehydrogenase catalytic domain-containing protein [Streptomyces sp. NPDC001795]|uniref:zinc-dependent alcohol dehydrogenase n=1 Tax=Streptomyces sp. NPDC001795 TaxID=3154525 RepID=UPI00331C03BB